ncbi:hypothetical protein F7R15_06255 [Pseudomonas reinekei]|uniref:Uncharacterized protein n=1 Tax=Pseudomonas reinekei TaxID=395598 RepID=A0A6H9RN16_PSERE|nr:hypothetical protein F7R15_06255 [Pseudomonas reinekei]
MDENTIPISPCLNQQSRADGPPKPPHENRGAKTLNTCLTLIHVGASLRAKAVYQPTSLVDVRPHSRAGSLPQGICVFI